MVGSRVVGYDSDALVYINAVEAADGQALEGSVKDAYNTFVVGCKSDGIWNAIKASCIMAGARTLSGALVPLVGVAPSGFNLASGTYSRVTGLKGDGAAMYLNSNRAGNADPQNSVHAAVYRTDTADPGTASFLGSQKSNSDRNVAFYTFSQSTGYGARKSPASDPTVASTSTTPGLIGVSRSSATSHTHRVAGSSTTGSISSIVPDATSIYVFANNANGSLATPTSARLAFYSIGESLDLALLDARVSGLMVAISGAIS